MNKRASLLVIFGVVLLISLFSSTIRAHAASSSAFVYTNVSVQQAKVMIDSNPSLVILDVRNQSEYDSGHIRNARLIPVWNLTQRLNELNKSDSILVYCKAGARSSEASQTLVDNSFLYVYNMIGGINAWNLAGYPAYVNYSSIQEAINNATEASTIYVSKGFYSEHLLINKSITLVGEDKYTTIIDGSSTGTIIHVAADNVSVSDFTVERPGCSCEGYYGIQIENNSEHISLTNNEVISDSVGVKTTRAQNVIIAHNDFSQNYVLSMSISDCSTILVTDNNMTGYLEGVEIADSNNIVFSSNILSGSSNGVKVENSSDCTFYGNDFWQGVWGISLVQSNSNLIFGNNFKGNFLDVASHNSKDSWSNGGEGNFWSNYTGVDADLDGIGDTPYVVDANNTDYCPLMGSFTSFESNDQQVDVISNSSITRFGFSVTNSSQGILVFKVVGQDGTQGFCRLSIPRALINGSYTVMFDGQVITEPQFRILSASNESYTYMYVNYTHSEHMMEISGQATIPEIPRFPLTAMLAVLMLATLSAAMVYRRKGPRVPHLVVST
jgi:parallel beta-helix repeat protein